MGAYVSGFEIQIKPLKLEFIVVMCAMEKKYIIRIDGAGDPEYIII